MEMITIQKMEHVRDYIHVVDLANAHVLALKFLEKQNMHSMLVLVKEFLF